jgi:hypothetical protein
MNGYEDAAVAGNGFRETRYKNSLPMMFKNDSTGLYAFMRAKPGDPSAPIVIHVVNWSDQNTACKLLLLKSALFDDAIGEIKCYLPVAYNEVIHEQAKATSNYSLLRKEKIPRILNDSDYMTIEVPSLDIWGIIVIEKA